jgi:CheY-like chemotaxis protein
MSESTADKYILVVDDEPDVRRYHAAILEDAGFTVDTAANGNEALEKVKERVPDLISLDLVMPEKSGLRFLYDLRRKQEWTTIPVIIVTAHAHDDLGRKDLEELRNGDVITGPQVCLDKPVRPENYVSAVMERLGMADRAPRPEAPEPLSLRHEVRQLIDAADEGTLKAMRDFLKGRAGG